MPEEKQRCWICPDIKDFLCACCHEQRQRTKQLEKEWDEQQAFTQKEINEQLELKL